jgi:stearoyl-CoA desaturase (delta-9 desaturase)
MTEAKEKEEESVLKLKSPSDGWVDTVVFHFKQGNFNWPMLIFITMAHVAAVYGFIRLINMTLLNDKPLEQHQKYTLLWSFLLWPISGLGITAGVHRLWAHRSYVASRPLRIFLMLANSIANQGSIWHWARDHRVHHKHSETDADPHNATRGFFFAHMGWLFIKKHPDIIKAGKELNFDDLIADGTVRFQKALDPWFALFMCYVFPGIVSAVCWGKGHVMETFWDGYWIGGALRYILVLHFTWFVNSAAHLFGDHPYDPTSYPAENPVVSLLALGEGWHNWHHKYPFDYAASEFGISKQFNPTKLFIDTCMFFRLASEPKRATGAWAKKKQIREQELYINGTNQLSNTKKAM